jgi:hypothetical protein
LCLLGGEICPWPCLPRQRTMCLDSLSSIVPSWIFDPLINNRSIIIWGFLKDDILALVEAWDSLQSYNILEDFGFF